MAKGKFLAIFLAVFGVSAFAAEGGNAGSQFLYQTPADKIQVSPYLQYYNLDVKLKSSTGFTKLKTTGPTEGVRTEYGISDMYSAALDISYTTNKSKYSPSGTSADNKGLNDLDFAFLGRMDLPSSSFRYGADVTFALSKKIKETNSDTNRASGGIGLEPFVGYEMYSDACTFGTKLSYLFYAGDRKEEDKSSTPTSNPDISGGETVTWSLFYEHNMKPLTLGANLEWSSTAKEETKTSSSTSVSAGQSLMALSIYTPYEMSDFITLLPRVTYGQLTAYNSAQIDSGSLYQIELKARMTF